MVIDPTDKRDILTTNPHLEELLKAHEIEVNEHTDKQIRYIALVYDPVSPLITKFPDIRERKKQAAKSTGFKTEANPNLIVLFLRKVFRNMDWTLICSLENTYDEFASRVNEPLDCKDDEATIKAVERKAKLLEHMERFCEKIKQLKKTFYCEDEALEAEEEEALSPESVALLRR